MKSLTQTKEKRDFIAREICKRIIGPGFTQEVYLCSPDASDEILSERPNREYTAGFLSPSPLIDNPSSTEVSLDCDQKLTEDNMTGCSHDKIYTTEAQDIDPGDDEDGLPVDNLQTDNTIDSTNPSDEGIQDDPTRERADFAPYYMGLIACVESTCNTINLEASYGVYKRVHEIAEVVRVPWGRCTKEQIEKSFEEYNKYALSSMALVGKKSIDELFTIDDAQKTISPRGIFSYTEEGTGKHKFLSPSNFPDLLYNRVARALCNLLKDPSKSYDCKYPTIENEDFKAVLDHLVTLDPVKNILEANGLEDICSLISYDAENREAKIEGVGNVDFSSLPDGVSLISLLLKDDPVKEYLLPKLLKTHFFKREQHDDVATLDISKTYGVEEISDNVEIYWKTFTSSKSKDKKYIRILAKNKNRISQASSTNKISEDQQTSPEKWLYQFQLKVLTNSFVAYTDPHTSTIDKELELNEKLYADEKMYGKGVNCALTWEYADSEEDNSQTPSWIQTTCSPKQKVRSFSATIKSEDKVASFNQVLDVYELSYFSEKEDKTIIEELRCLANSYATWHEKQCSSVVDKTDVLYQLIEEQKDFLQRFNDNITYLEKNERAMRCFRIANAAMYIQMLLTKDENFSNKSRKLSSFSTTFNYGSDLNELLTYFKGKHCPKGDTICYRPFQLAFLVMNIKSTFENNDAYRNDNVDLIWFPTGGGKTEAYLALTALTIVERRTSRDHDVSGVSVIMRYTLRMLTSQQFQRASYLITALDFLRRADSSLNLGEPITLGLWIGSGVTPNKNDGLRDGVYKKYFDHVVNNDVSEENISIPFPVSSCPWCGSKLTQMVSATGRFLSGYDKDGNIHCINRSCAFSEKLPIEYIDENLYNNPPTLLFATVDKFAQLQASGAQELFGVGEQRRKPDLIIQDELHLISGPLGSMVGLYETLVEELCSTNENNTTRRPKIIASTATTRNTAHLVKELYNRSVKTFPVSGVKYDDNFFSYAQPLKDSKRLYLGFSPTAHTAAELEIRTISAELIAKELLIRNQLRDKGVDLLNVSKVLTALCDGNSYLHHDYDLYWTIVSYYINLQSLGKTCSRIGQEILENVNNMRSFIETYPALVPLNNNFHNRATELTSRQDSSKIKELLTSAEMPTQLQSEPSSYRVISNMDIVLATNMISVGIDIERWNVINMIGQPPTTAEYIQSSSRVGRKHDGLVVSLYNPLKNRELSYYENYIAYHKVFYKYVEPLSVTTFTEMTLQRLLSNLFVSYMLLIKQRNRLRDITPNDVDCFKDFLSSRSKSINVESHKVFEPNMSDMVDRIYYACFDVVHNPSLYRQRNEYIRSYIISNDYKGKKEFPLMGSLRDVESDTILIYE